MSEWICDGETDCVNGTDEETCGQQLLSLYNNNMIAFHKPNLTQTSTSNLIPHI